MSWVARMVEQRLAEAARSGELDAGPLQGKPIPGIDERRPDGWWARQFVRRELSHDRRKVAVAAAATARVAFWQAPSEEAVGELVRAATEAIATANINLVAGDQLDPFDLGNVLETWRSLRRRPSA